MDAMAATSRTANDRTDSAPAVLEIDRLSTYFFTSGGVVRAVDDLSIAVAPGEILGIVGESGSGKSVTGLSVLGLVDEPGRIVGGQIRFRGEDLTKLPIRKLRAVRGGGVGMVFQDPMTSLNPVKRIAGQIMEAIRAHNRVGTADARGRAVQLLKRMRIPAAERAIEAYPHQFSGGMRQRVVIAIGTANQPQLLVADEPTTALDVTVQREILSLLRELTKGSGTAIMLITHNLGVVAAVCDRVAVMYAGEIVESGRAEDVLAKASHPYTQSLLNAVPRMDQPLDGDRRLAIVQGTPPSPGFVPTGCRFLPRCPFAIDRCETHPDLLAVGTAHEARCWVAQAGGEPPWRRSRAPAAPSSIPRTGASTPDLLVVEGISKWFGTGRGLGRASPQFKAVDKVSLALGRGRTLGLVGESGSGKSTVARMITRLTEPSEGRILFEGTDITGLTGAGLRPVRSRLQMIFQDPYASLNPRMTVFETVAEAFRFHHPGTSAAEVRDRVSATLARVGLDAAGHQARYPHEFSGGQRQRIGIARSLVVNPSCIVADEPVSALDVNVQGQIINLMVDLQEERGLAYLFIAHDLAVVRHICDDVAVMYLGRIVESAPSSEIFRTPRHPYTRLLIDSAPIPDVAAERARRIVTSSGEVPSPLAKPSGCSFRTRCPRAGPLCAEVEPPLMAGGASRSVACHFPLAD